MKIYAIYKDTSDFESSEEAIAFFTQRKYANCAILSLRESESDLILYSIKTIIVNEHVKFLQSKLHKFCARSYINNGEIRIAKVYPVEFTTEQTFTHETNKQGNSSVKLIFAATSIGKARVQAPALIEREAKKNNLLPPTQPKQP